MGSVCMTGGDLTPLRATFCISKLTLLHMKKVQSVSCIFNGVNNLTKRTIPYSGVFPYKSLCGGLYCNIGDSNFQRMGSHDICHDAPLKGLLEASTTSYEFIFYHYRIIYTLQRACVLTFKVRWIVLETSWKLHC